jgi:hypothetical protein
MVAAERRGAMTKSSRFSLLFLVMLAASSFGQTPFVITEAPNSSIKIDGDISDWNALAGPNRVLDMSWAHDPGRTGDPDSAPLVVKIQYAWDADRFYTLVEEVSDDDPSAGYNEVDWCGDCIDVDDTNPDLPNNPAPWNTDSVGFYDKGIKWPGNPDDPAADVQEVGPFSQWWVGLTTKDELTVNGEKQYRMMTRRLDDQAIMDNGRTGQLIGPKSVENEGSIPLIPDLPELTTPQSEAGVIDGPENGGRGRRFVEFYMEWDQIRYSRNDPRPEVQDRIAALDPNLEGHFLEDVKTGYEFRLDPLLVDGTEDFSFGSQTHPSGMEHPQQTENGVEDIAVVRLIGSIITTPGDLDGDGDSDAADIDALADAIRTGQTAAEFDLNSDASVNASDYSYLIETVKNTYIGDSNLDGEFNSADFVAVFTAGEYEDAAAGNSGWAEGDWNGSGDFDSSDFVSAFQAGGYEKGPRAAVPTVPEPCGLWLFGFLSFVVPGYLRRKARERRT